MNLDYFHMINNSYKASSKQETELYLINRNEERFLYDNIDFKKVLKNKKPYEMLIIKGTSDTNKKIKALHSTPFCLGDYIEWNNQVWLVTSLDSDDKVHISGNMELCTTTIHWQKKNGVIVSRWAVCSDYTKYDSGIISNGIISIGSNQYGLTLPIDNETKILARDSRFVLDVITGEDYEKGYVPDVYKLTNRKAVLNNYNNFDKGGTIILTMSMDSFDASIDKYMDLGNGTYGWICGQKSENVTKPDPTTNIIYSINGEDSIYAEFKRIWTAEFTDENNSPTTADNWSWNVVPNFDVIASTNISSEFSIVELENNQIQITAGNDYIGETFTIQIVSDGKVVAEKNVLIMGF